jgi:hypothetical protein
MPSERKVKNNCRVTCRFALFGEREEMNHLGKSVNNYPEIVASVGAWQVRDEVHSDGLPRGVRELKWREQPVGVMPRCLVALALGAAPDEVHNSFVHLGPPEVSSKELNSLVLTHMASKLRIVLRFEDRVDQVLILRDLVHTLSVAQPILDLEDILLAYLAAIRRCLTWALRNLLLQRQLRQHFLYCCITKRHLVCLLVYWIRFSCLFHQNHEVVRPPPSWE